MRHQKSWDNCCSNYAGALEMGWRGLSLMRQFAIRHPIAARNTNPKSLKMLSGGISPREAAWDELRKGRKIRPSRVALFVGLNNEPSTGLRRALTRLSEHHGLCIGVVSVMGRDRLELWRPTNV